MKTAKTKAGPQFTVRSSDLSAAVLIALWAALIGGFIFEIARGARGNPPPIPPTPAAPAANAVPRELIEYGAP